jgi:soluble lytic murein transglycosylase-like protein
MRTAVGTRWSLWALVALALAAFVAAPADELLYYVEDGRVVFTNVPSRRDVRVVPGFERRVAEALRGKMPATRYDRLIEAAAAAHGVSPDLVKAVAMVESAFNASARSPKGAMGLMQLMPSTARAYGVTDPYDPEQSLNAGAALLADLLQEFDGNRTLALAAYNAGAGAVRRHGGVPAYRETRDYVRKVDARLSAGSAPDRTLVPASAKRATGLQAKTLADGSLMISN